MDIIGLASTDQHCNVLINCNDEVLATVSYEST